MRTTIVGVAAALAVLAVPAGASAAQFVNPTLEISNPRAHLGDTITIAGTGWSGWDESGGNCEAVTVKLYSLNVGGARLKIKTPPLTPYLQIFQQFRFKWKVTGPAGVSALGTWRMVASQPCDDPDGDPAPEYVQKLFKIVH
jgi:hypothetical protein